MIKKITRSIALAALFLIPLLPLIVANDFFFPYITGKAFYFRVLVELAFASWIILAFIDAKYRPKINAIGIGVTVFALVALAADLLGVNPLRSIWSNFERMEGWMTIVHLWMFFMVVTSLFGHGEEGRKMWHRWFSVELGTAMFIGLYSMLQLAGVLAIHQGSIRIDATLGNAAYMAVYMLINVGIAVFMLQSQSAKQRWSFKINVRENGIYWASFVVSLALAIALLSTKDGVSSFFTLFNTFISGHVWQFIFGTVLTIAALLYPNKILPVFFAFLVFETATRGTILGLIGGIVLSLALYATFGKKEPKKNRSLAIYIIIGIILLGVVFWFNRGSQFVQRSEVLSRMASISWSEAQGQARNYVWPMAIKGWTERPILGWGQENFNYIFNANYNPKMWNQEQWFDRAHSVFLDWLVASGLVGFLAYVSLYVLFLMAIWRSSLTIAEKSVLTGLMAGYAVHNVFVFDNLASYMLFFTLLGFAATLIEKKSAILAKKTASIETTEYVVAPVVIIVFVLSIYFVNIRPIQANTGLITALRSCGGGYPGSIPDPSLFDKVFSIGTYMSNQEAREQLLTCVVPVLQAASIPTQTRQSFFQLTVKGIRDQIVATPKDTRIYSLAGSFYNQLGAIDQAESLLKDAYTLSPGKQSIGLSLAADYLQGGKTDEAIALLKTLYESATNHTAARDMYAVALVFGGKEAEAKAIFKDEPSVFLNSQMAQAYMSLKQYSKGLAIYEALVAASPTDIDAKVQLARAQYLAGMKSKFVETLRGIEKTNPELKDQIEAAIEQALK